MDRAQTFFEAVFKIEMDRHQRDSIEMAWFPMSGDATGAGGTLAKGEGYTPSHEGSLVYITTPDIDAALERVKKKGGKVLGEKTDIGEYGYVAFFEDTEGNRVAMHRKK